MRIKLFGPPSVWRDDQPVAGALAQRRRLALVSVLAVAAPPGRSGVTRERVLALLWPSDDEERARAALSQALYAVRRDLGADDAILGQGDLRLHPQRVTCDYWDFLQAVAEGADTAAAELRAGPLMDGLEIPEVRDFEFWVEEQRAEADRQWAAAADRVAAAATRGGDTATAVRWRRALANADPLSGRTAVLLAQALEAAGEREAALRHLRVHATLVEQELETTPSADVTEYLAALARPAAPAPVNAARVVSAPAPALPVAPTRTPPVPASPTAVVEASAPAAALGPATTTPIVPPAPAPPARRWRWAFGGIGVAVLALALALAAWVATRAPSPDASAPPADSLTVFAVAPIGGDSLGPAVAGMLATNLSRGRDVEVISTARMLELTAGGGAALSAAREAGATDLVEGTLLRQGETWQLELRRTAVGTGRVAGAVRVAAPDLFAAVDRASADLLRELAPVLSSEGIAEVSTGSVEAWRLYEEGLRANTEGRTAVARALFRGALRADSTFALAMLALGSLPGENGVALLERAMRVSTRLPEPQRLWIRANWYQATDDPRFAAVVDTMVARYPSDLDVQMMIAGPALFDRADVATASAALARVWRRDSARAAMPGRTRCYACEATLHLQTVYELADSLPAAERWVRTLLAVRPTDPVAWRRLASILERDVRRHDEMRAAVDSAVRHGDPTASAIALAAATRLGDTLAFEAAARALGWPREADTPEAHWARALLYRNAGRLDDALREARAHTRVLATGPSEDLHTKRSLEAAVLLERGDARAAATIWDSIARLPRPEATPSKRARQRVYFGTLAATARFEAGDTTGLRATADSFAVIGARSGYARDRALHHHVRGLAALAEGRLEDAIAELQRAIVYPSAGLTRSNWYLAQALERAGRPADARRWYEAAARGARDGAAMYVNPVSVRRRLAALGGR